MKKIGFIHAIEEVTLPCTMYVDNKGAYVIGIHSFREDNPVEEMFYIDVDSFSQRGEGFGDEGQKRACLFTFDDRKASIAPLHELVTEQAIKVIAEHIMLEKE